MINNMIYLSVLIVLGGILSLGEAFFTVCRNDVFDREVSEVSLQGLGNKAYCIHQKTSKLLLSPSFFIEFIKNICRTLFQANEDVVKAVGDTFSYLLNKKRTFSGLLRSVSDTAELVLSQLDLEVIGPYLRKIFHSVADMIDRIDQNRRHGSGIGAFLHDILVTIISSISLDKDQFNTLSVYANLLHIFDLDKLNFKDFLQDASIAIREVVS